VTPVQSVTQWVTHPYQLPTCLPAWHSHTHLNINATTASNRLVYPYMHVYFWDCRGMTTYAQPGRDGATMAACRVQNSIRAGTGDVHNPRMPLPNALPVRCRVHNNRHLLTYLLTYIDSQQHWLLLVRTNLLCLSQASIFLFFDPVAVSIPLSKLLRNSNAELPQWTVFTSISSVHCHFSWRKL